METLGLLMPNGRLAEVTTYNSRVVGSNPASYPLYKSHFVTGGEQMFTVYLAGPISGLSYDEASNRIKRVRYELERDLGNVLVLHPLTAKGYLRNELNLAPNGYKYPPSTDHAIVERDMWMVKQADIVLCNLCGAKTISIGSVAELAWAHMLGKHTVVAMEPENLHQHAFVLQMADVVFPQEKEAIQYCQNLIMGRF
jgi:nucleoside 2-deoxyribosyltransferase